jgi:hypothetical protein
MSFHAFETAASLLFGASGWLLLRVAERARAADTRSVERRPLGRVRHASTAATAATMFPAISNVDRSQVCVTVRPARTAGTDGAAYAT